MDRPAGIRCVDPEERRALPEMRDRRPVPAAGVLHVRVGRGHEHRGLDVHAAEGLVGRTLVADQRLQRLGVAAQHRQRRVVRRAPRGVPRAAVDVYQAARTFHVDQVHAVGPEQGDIDLEDLAALPELEVVDDGKGIWQMIAQVGDRLPLGVVDRLADGHDLRHQAAPCPSIQRSTTARASRSLVTASCRAVRTAKARRPRRSICPSSRRGSTTPLTLASSRDGIDEPYARALSCRRAVLR